MIHLKTWFIQNMVHPKHGSITINFKISQQNYKKYHKTKPQNDYKTTTIIRVNHSHPDTYSDYKLF
jgi:hypothetical protein